MGSPKKSTTNTSESTTAQDFWNPEVLAQYGTQSDALNAQYQSLLDNPVDISYSSTPNGIVNYMLAKGQQDIKNQQAAGDRAIASQLSVGGTGENSALIGALQRQGKIAQAGAGNALVPMALEQQRAYDESAINNRLQNRQLDLGTLGQGSQLLQQLGAFGQATAKRTGTSVSRSQTKQKSGIFGF